MYFYNIFSYKIVQLPIVWIFPYFNIYFFSIYVSLMLPFDLAITILKCRDIPLIFEFCSINICHFQYHYLILCPVCFLGYKYLLVQLMQSVGFSHFVVNLQVPTSLHLWLSNSTCRFLKSENLKSCLFYVQLEDPSKWIDITWFPK